MTISSISLLLSSIIAIWLYDQSSRHNFPLGLNAGSLVFLLCAYYSLIQLALLVRRFSKALDWGRFSLILLSPLLLFSMILLPFVAGDKFGYETLFSDQEYQIISQFAPVSGGNSMYWVLKKSGISRWKASDMQYGRTKEFMPKVIQIDGRSALVRDDYGLR